MSQSHPQRVTFPDVLKVPEFRAVWLADAQSLIGDQLARVALSILVFASTGSTVWTALAYALTFLPAIAGGALLSGIADRYPRRDVMIWCDLMRATLVGLMALPQLPIVAVCILLVLVVFVGPAFASAETAMLPQILDGERFVVGQALRTTTGQLAQLAGFAGGGIVVAAIGARAGLAVDAATFALSALIVWRGVRARPAAARTKGQQPYLRSQGRAMRLIMSHPALRLLLGFGWLAGFYIAPEGLAAPYAAGVGGGSVSVGLLLAALPAGTAVGAWALVRFVKASVRPRLIGAFAVAAGLALTPCAAQPGIAVSLLLWFACGVCCGYQVLAAAAFVQRTPDAQRAQVFGMAAAGLIAVQGVGVLLFGFVAEQLDPHAAVAIAGGAGAALAFVLAVAWRARSSEDSLATQNSTSAAQVVDA